MPDEFDSWLEGLGVKGPKPSDKGDSKGGADPDKPWSLDIIDPKKKPPVNLKLPPDYDPDRPVGPRKQPGPPNVLKPVPPAPPRSDPIDDALNRDPILRKMPKVLRDAIKDAIRDADEAIVDEALDHLNSDSATKNALKAAAKAFLKSAKGKKWDPPPQPSREPPPSGAPPFPKAPGEVIIPGPKIKW